ncbi:flavin reductase [Pararhizobium polonicum]|uniref:Flavin reductase n=1 Tax=Pararhizobium polonicum TaxID=1612624 RepID=A0A1C7P0D2_9HYPH|nr:flavin reductase family protein [Pararhizobium polonicum]OBZ94711.1 flavin reductase [Pararhizobium polonicum]
MEAFFSAFRHHPSGVAIITADAGDGPVALTVSSLISVSASPPMVAFSLSASSSTAKAVEQAETVVVHFVRRGDMKLARLCATSGVDRFGADVRWERLASGEPYYPQVGFWFRAALRGRLAVPGACLVTAELLSASPFAQDARGDDTLVYANRTWHELRTISEENKAPLLLWPEDSATF